MTRWLSPLMDICQDTGQDKGNAYRRLQDLVAAGLVVRDGRAWLYLL